MRCSFALCEASYQLHHDPTRKCQRDEKGRDGDLHADEELKVDAAMKRQRPLWRGAADGQALTKPAVVMLARALVVALLAAVRAIAHTQRTVRKEATARARALSRPLASLLGRERAGVA